ncbi:sigma-70 family RNA polymerase sigma factor [Kitasatospora cheerisanensis]|nr:sigma-70 family RNA polymerase sigma factor [Kitasatospora cheerisanensis]
MLGDRSAADEVALEVFTHLCCHWAEALEAPDFEAHTRTVLVGAVTYRVHRLRREHDLAARLHAARRLLRQIRETLVNADGGVGLFAAIADLPDRQQEVVILRYSMGYTSAFTALILNLASRTVDYHCRHAVASLDQTLTGLHVLRRTTVIPRPRREGVR